MIGVLLRNHKKMPLIARYGNAIVETSLPTASLVIFGFFIKGNENTTSSIRLYNADKKFIKSYYNHFNLQETKFIQPEKNLGVSGMELGIQKISNERFLINYLRFYIFKGDEYKDALPPYNKNINEGSYLDRSKNYVYKLKKIKK